VPLTDWESFYVIVGSSAAALTGLQFVVIALIADVRRKGTSHEIAAFGTPNVVHFCAVLLVSAILSAPWHALANPAIALQASGAAGIVYVLIVLRRARRQTGYKPVFEDWLSHVILPLLGYSGLLAAALLLQARPVPALFGIATTSLLLLFVGIHNAWDTVTYITVQAWKAAEEEDSRAADLKTGTPPRP
jgi:hypothetical protein